MKRIVIVGTSSGIGQALARIYARKGDMVGITGRRNELLQSLHKEFPENIKTSCFDVSGNENIKMLRLLIRELGGMDLLIYNSGYGESSHALDWDIDKITVDTNVVGFLEIIDFAFNYFIEQGHGQLATTSSIASKRGSDYAPAYSASKAFQSIYFEGLHMKLKKLKVPIYVTDIQPGFVDTKMAKSYKRFWVAPVEKAAAQIVTAIQRKKWRVYVTKRWKLIAILLPWIPDFIYHKVR
ncbi:MAG: SDR family NAD(P)-dependent oxidoreductase [Chitinophagales bacterium]